MAFILFAQYFVDGGGRGAYKGKSIAAGFVGFPKAGRHHTVTDQLPAGKEEREV